MIRQMTSTDYKVVAKIQINARQVAYAPIFGNTFIEISQEKREKDVKEWATKDGSAGFVFEDAQDVKGFIIANLDDAVCTVEYLFVEPHLQGQGVGAALLVHCENYAKASGITIMKLWVLKDNAPARGFYEKHGYAVTGEETQFGDTGIFETHYVKELP